MSAKKPNIIIIGGNGKFGSWFVRFFQKEEIPVKALGRADKKDLLREVAGADIVIVSVPISQTVDMIRAIRNTVRPDALLCDFTSLKHVPLQEMLKTKSGCGVTGIHPMFGPLVTSLRNQSIVFCSGRDNAWTTYLRTLFARKGARIITATAKEHDKKMAIIQALTHFLNILFGAVLRGQDTTELNAYSSPVFRLQHILSARVLGGKADLYADIAMMNPSVRKVLTTVERAYRTLSRAILNKDRATYARIYEATARSLAQSIPLSQARSTELFNIVDRQPIHVSGSVHAPVMAGRRTIFTLGPEGTFSHQAARRIFGQTAPVTFCETIRDVFEEVMDGPANALGVVPIENSTQGIVQETLDCFAKFPVATVGSHVLPVHLCVFGRARSLDDVRVIRSHPQPLAQAKEWIRHHVPDVRLETTASSTKAIRETDDPSVAFIGSMEAARAHRLRILAKNIEDKKNNATEFYVIAKSQDASLSTRLHANKTVLILIIHDRPGVLRDILDAFARHRINLTKLHSKSSDLEDYDYYFFLEAEGVPEEPAMVEALREISSYCYITRVLGKG